MLPFPNKKYNIIYADPPWKYTSWSEKTKDKGRGLAISHYNLMSLEELSSLQIKEISHEDCALFLWTTAPFLGEAFTLIKNWGFVYRTLAFNWIKTTKNGKLFFGMGNYTRSNSELCLLATKGKMKVIDKSVFQIIMSPREEHSKKPDIVGEKIVKLFGDLPRIELFARKSVDGWDSWGNEI